MTAWTPGGVCNSSTQLPGTYFTMPNLRCVTQGTRSRSCFPVPSAHMFRTCVKTRARQDSNLRPRDYGNPVLPKGYRRAGLMVSTRTEGEPSPIRCISDSKQRIPYDQIVRRYHPWEPAPLLTLETVTFLHKLHATPNRALWRAAFIRARGSPRCDQT